MRPVPLSDFRSAASACAAFLLALPASAGESGKMTREMWGGLPGSQLSVFTDSPRYWQPADAVSSFTGSAAPTNAGDNCASRIRAYITAPVTGNHTFWIASNDDSELRLSTDDSKFHRVKIASLAGYVGVQAWDVKTSQKSALIPLVAGQRYFIEALHKENTGVADHVEIAWQIPGGVRELIPASALESFTAEPNDLDNDELRDDWELAHGFDPNAPQAGDFVANADPDKDGMTNLEESEIATAPLSGDAFAGRLTVERWDGHIGYNVADLIADQRFYGAPTSRRTFGENRYFDIPQGTGIRMRGRVTAPESGYYRFWLSASNAAELWLSSDSTKYRKQRIAVLGGDAGTGHGIRSNSTNLWDNFSCQMSGAIYLEAGQSYFLETLSSQYHIGDRHISLAWARPGQAREALPMNSVSSYPLETADADDDYIPDSWETQYGLSLTDNGGIDRAREGERGDFDADGLTNREEYLLGTDPTNADTDGDGESDGIEVNSLGSNALVANAITDTFLGEIALGGFTGSSTAWTMTSGGLLADSFRGEATWDFSVPTAGNWLFRLNLELMGATYGNEEVPVVIKVDGKTVVRRHVRFGSGKFGILQALSPWLGAGNHRISVLVDNTIARRTVRLVSLKIHAPSNAAATLAQDNRVLSHPAATRTSPAFIEGFARDPGTVSVNGVPATAGTGDGHWFANIQLANQAESQVHAIQFEQGWETTGALTWQATNVMAAETLTIRRGDALRVGAWGSDPAATSTVTLSSGGTTALTGQQTTTLTFASAGTFSVTGTVTGGGSATLTVKVIAPPGFPAATVDALDHATRTLSISAVPEIAFDAPENHARLVISRTGTTASIGILPNLPEEFSIAARLFTGGPVLAVQRVNVIGLSDALQNDLTSGAAGNIAGYKLVTSPLTVLNLPPGARVDVSILRAGVMFPNGTTLRRIYPADLSNGSVILEFLYPLGQPGGYCHNLLVYDRNGLYLGTR